MKLLQRIKNLWTLSAYFPAKHDFIHGIDERFYTVLEKDFPTIKKKLATIIQTETKDILEKEIDDNTDK